MILENLSLPGPDTYRCAGQRDETLRVVRDHAEKPLMDFRLKPIAAVALALALVGAIPAVANADDLPTDMFAEPFEVTGGPEEQAFLATDAQVGRTLSAESLGIESPSALAVSDAVTISGAGYGHGIGLSQWGAYGRAHTDPGATYQNILEFYYGGSSAGTSLVSYDTKVPGHDSLRVNLEYDRTNLMLRVLDTGSTAPGGGHVPATVTRGVETIDLVAPQTVQIVWKSENTCSLAFRDSTQLAETPFAEWADGSCDVDVVWDGASASPSTKIEVEGCLLRDWDAGVDRPCQYGRGNGLHTIDNESPQRNPSGMDAAYDGFDLVLDIDVDDYTLGISEVSYSWPSAALQSQAVAARSYAAAANERYDPMSQACACDVYDTSRSQRYVGWGHIGAFVGGGFTQQNWIDAATATDNVVLANPSATDNGIINAVYSAANGGASENNEDIWGGAPLPYLRSTPDPYDAMRDTNWTRSVPVDYFAARVGMDTVSAVEIVATYVSGSPSDIAVTGMKDGVGMTKHYTATEFMARFAGTSYSLYSPRILNVAVAAPPPPPFELARLAGADRYATAVAISQDGYPSTSDTVFIATGENFPDALAVAPLAHQLGGPVLLTQTSSLPDTTKNEIERLNPNSIYILGGTVAISQSVEQALAGLAPVTRLWGDDRYATAAAISQTAFPGGAAIAYVAVGSDFPDALVAAPVSADRNGPLLLTRPDILSSPTRAELVRLAPDIIVVVGGGTGISSNVVATLGSFGANVTVLSGPDRYVTSTEVSANAFPSGADTVYVARGTLYPDGLAGGPAAADAPGPILLVREATLPAAVADELVRLSPSRVVILGGESAVSASVEQAILDLLG